VHIVTLVPAVKETSKIILYYRLSRSTWPLSNNKEVFCRLCWAIPGKSATTGSLICAKPTRRRNQSTSSTLHKSPQVHIITNQVFIHRCPHESMCGRAVAGVRTRALARRRCRPTLFQNNIPIFKIA
jgi:hypothetical protein